MELISSRITRFYKRGIPILVLSVILFVSIGGTWQAIAAGEPWQAVLPGVIVSFIFMMLILSFIFYLFHRFVFDLVDAVYLDDDEIMVNNDGLDYRFGIPDIKEIRYLGFVNPPRVTLILYESVQPFGDKIVFTPAITIFRFHTPAVVRQLMIRVEDAQIERRRSAHFIN